MKLKTILSKFNTSQEINQEPFLALEISTETVKSAVWTVEQEKTVLLKTGSIEEWEEENEESLVTAADASITNTCEGITPEPTKVIFGLPENWTKGEEITEKKKELLKTLCTKLELKPLGFVVTLEALISFLKEKEGTPISAIFIGLSETQSIISLVRLGKIKGTQVVGRSDDLAADVREGLVRFGKLGDLPSRMILFDGVADFEEAKQQLISFDWQEHLPFLHFPKVDSLDVLTPVKAVVIAGGAEVAKSLGFEIKGEKKEPRDFVTNEENRKEIEEEKEGLAAADLGFFQDQDIEQVKETRLEKVAELPQEGEKKTPFKPVLKQQEKEKAKFSLGKIFHKIAGFFTIFRKIPFRFPPFLTRRGPVLIILPIILFSLFLAAGLAFYWYIPRATVNLYLKAKVLEKEFDLIIDSHTSSVDKDKGIIPGDLKEVEVSGQKTKETTGEKIVGDKAKGEVIIYNKTEVAKIFPQNTVLIGPDKLAFVLEEETMVASSSASEEGITYGKAKAAVIASSIGTESNLAADTQFSIKDYPSSSYSAKTEQGFSGGTSRQVRAVSKEDKSLLLKELTDELRTQAQKEIVKQVSSNEEFLDQEAKMDILTQKFSADEDEEVDKLTLDLKIKFVFLSYKKENLKQFLEKKVADNIPSDYLPDYEGSQIEVKKIDFGEKETKLKALIKLNLLPQLNLEEIKANLKGRYPEVIQDYLESLPNFSRADIKITPPLPVKLRTLPRLSKNITIEIKIEK